MSLSFCWYTVLVKSFLRNCRGVFVFGLMTLSTIFWFAPILILAIVKLVLPISIVHRYIASILMAMGAIWVSTNTAILRTTGSIDWKGRGFDKLQLDGWYLIIVNHQTWVDIVVLQELFRGHAPFLKFFIKQELVWFPVLGLAWWAMDMPFMKRYSPSYLARNPHMKGRDIETTRRACEKFRNTPTSILNFVEGTRFSEQKRVDRKSPYRNLLQPRAGALAIAIASMGKLSTSIVDVTLVYPDGPVSFWDMCCGSHAQVIARVEEKGLDDWLINGNYEADRAFRKRLHGWLADIWTDKDATIDAMKKTPNDE